MNRIVLAIIINKGKVLVAKVHKDYIKKFNGLEYVFPGGVVEDGETDEDALIREIKSETGYSITVEGQISFWISPTTKEEVYSYYCKTNDIDQKLYIKNKNTESLHWFTLEELDEYYPEMNPDVRRYLRLVLSESKIE